MIDDSIKAESNTAAKNTSAINNLQTNPNLLALNANGDKFWKKNKLYIFAGVGGAVVIIILAIGIIIYRQHSAKKELKARMSINSNIE